LPVDESIFGAYPLLTRGKTWTWPEDNLSVCLSAVFLTAVMEVQLLLCCMYVGWDLKPNLCLKYGFLKGKDSNSIKSFFYLLLAFVCASF
jgi:hypothetical protein